MNAKELAASTLRLVGGEANVASLVHCATRLRFSLRDLSKANSAAIEKLDGVITTVNSAGQFQVVIGNRVAEVYREFGAISSLLEDNRSAQSESAAASASVLGRLVDIVAGIFTPLLGAMAASGVLKGLLTIFLALGWMAPTQSTYIILHAASDSLFYFLPILLAITSARKFNTNVFVAVSIAGALIYPSIQQLFNQPDITFLGLPVVMMKYTSSVMPIILAVFLMSYFERFLNRRIHESVRNILTPFLLLIVMVPLTLMTIGPFGIYASEAAAWSFVKIYGFNPIIASALFAAAWQIMVIFGIHWGFVTLFINDISVLGRSHLKAATGPAVFSQAGAVLGVMLRSKNKKLKALSGSAFIAAMFGITEPAVYGITLKLKKPFICAVIAAAAGGAVVGYANSSALSMGMTSLLTIPIFYGEGFVGFLVGTAIAFVLAALLTYIVGFDDPIDDDAAVAQPKAPLTEAATATALTRAGAPAGGVIIAPIRGKVVALEQVNDKVFSSGVVGRGVAIRPEEGKVYSPVDGVISSTFASAHALGILSDDGAEILIHIGLDTVRLQGRHFQSHVKEGQVVKCGDLLIEFDLQALENAGFDVITPVLVTNADDYPALAASHKVSTAPGDVLIALC
ncbi:PTS beta-glucoside transporter subunit IIABC [Affinibrenneria salicis]|uniref:PTS beta-glucoside transporter subunit IIABC n=1 Tax=Affinibrenneria salicis TaxID=2590031 RepID=A0A5J5FQY9_9GAMM|nr:beta-glucoside-specific PTS transporter subunit IIABC [Affinibrenneria salicis]KAA8994931.1 PTS beta-glucoside transporter subunit IIABC [Affinibrenneria salicis]